MSPAVEVQSLNHWIAREVPPKQFYTYDIYEDFIIYINTYLYINACGIYIYLLYTYLLHETMIS